MTTGVVCPLPILQFFLSNGQLAVGGSILTQVGGVNAATYQDLGLTTPLPNPIPLNSRGEISDASGISRQLFLTPNTVYTFTFADANGNQIWQATYVNGFQLTQALIGQTFYPQTPLEQSLSITPTNYQYLADPWIDPRRYGAKQDGVTDDTAAWTTALSVAKAAQGTILIANGCTALVQSLALTLAVGGGIRILGSSIGGSQLKLASGATGPLLSFTSATPGGVFITLENLTLANAGTPRTTGVHGISMTGLAYFVLNGVYISNFDAGFNGVNIETCTFRDCQVVNNNTNLKVSYSGGGFTSNLIRVHDCVINGAVSRGIDYDGGTGLYVHNCDLEGNGTASDTTTGAIYIGTQNSPDLLEGHIVVSECWFEGNHGWTFQQSAQTNGNAQRVTLKSCEVISPESGRAIFVGGASFLTIEDIASGTSGDTWNLTASQAILRNCTVSTLTDTGIVSPVYENVITSAGGQTWGRRDTATLTLTGVSGTVTQTGTFFEQGGWVTLILAGDLLGTSTANTCTIMGIPSRYQLGGAIPAIQLPLLIQDNGSQANPGTYAILANASGTLTLTKGDSATGFTSSGSKGVKRQPFPAWRLDA